MGNLMGVEFLHGGMEGGKQAPRHRRVRNDTMASAMSAESMSVKRVMHKHRNNSSSFMGVC